MKVNLTDELVPNLYNWCSVGWPALSWSKRHKMSLLLLLYQVT